MLNCYLQILWTYCTNWRRLPLATVMFICILGGLSQARDGFSGYMGFVIFALWPVGIVVFHLKQQIASPQARLLPNYRVPHLMVAAILLLPMLLLPPLVASWPHTDTEPAFTLKLRAPSPGNNPPAPPSHDAVFVPPSPHSLPYFPLLSLQFALMACLAWTIYKMSGVMFASAVAICFADRAAPIHHLLLHFVAMPFSFAAAIVFSGAMIAFGVLTHRFFCLTEEMPEYARSHSLFGGEKATSSNRFRISSKPDYTSRWQQFFSAAPDRAIDRAAASSHQTFLHRVSRSRAPTKNGTALLMPVLICLVGLLINSQSSTGGVPFIWMMLWLLPIVVTLGIAIRRRPLLGYESLRPVSRSAFLKELAFAVGLQFTEIWITIAATLIIVAALSTPHLLGDPQIWLYLVTTYMAQLVLLAIVLWLLRFTTNMLLYMFIFMFPVFVAPFGLNLHEANLLTPFACIAAILSIIIVAAVLAALILADAYRRWLLTDLP